MKVKTVFLRDVSIHHDLCLKLYKVDECGYNTQPRL